ncbi:HigA family addiction module antitoxin [Eubacterium ruminantium]|uniref:HTH cro/C1-type domain-containing protein n=1 Tax=Eubacterium ruminantium TaxID=42322 RepID=A0A1T4MBN1_9FIRM|nr:HigA family addiction module antitoxin [Eubacterium ruminantium]SCW46793.1 protein of unknown function [Eubacterium ruminantium]SDM53444.1 protein of unknown function [Eubacterium ruminantium]SJZ64114.1 protein of unknown function [Eubacterium ruminantium]
MDDNKKMELQHPGNALAELLEEMGMTQRELSYRTGVTEKHISTVVKGNKDISTAFAKKLEYALSKPMNYWIDLQANYDNQKMNLEKNLGIDDEEKKVFKRLSDIIDYLEKTELIYAASNDTDKIVEVRKFMGVSNLKYISKIQYNAAYRAQVNNNVNVDPYVLYAWKRICESCANRIQLDAKLDIDKLKKRLYEIKNLMFSNLSDINKELTSIFKECGIAFMIVPHFKGAPVQGFISRLDNGKVMLCLTLRQKRADKFWFTLFHEIGHLINGDVDNSFVDFSSVKSDNEEQADLFAGNILLDSEAYRLFLMNGDYTLKSIKDFSKQQNVKPYIVIGRLQNDGELEWNEYSLEMVYYEWVA